MLEFIGIIKSLMCHAEKLRLRSNGAPLKFFRQEVMGRLLSGGSAGVKGKIKEISYKDGAEGDGSLNCSQWR